MPLGKCKGVVKFTIPFRDKIWGVKTPWQEKIFCGVKRLYRLNFQRLAQVGVTNSIGFKPNTYKGMSFLQKCIKSCTTVGQPHINQN